MNPADLTDFALESLFTEARKTRDLAGALRFVLDEVDRRRCAGLLPDVVAVTDEVASRFATTRELLLGREQKYHLARPRVIAWWVLHYRFDVNYPTIAAQFQGRHYSTICKTVAELTSAIKTDDVLRATLAGIEAAVRGRLMERAAA